MTMMKLKRALFLFALCFVHTAFAYQCESCSTYCSSDSGCSSTRINGQTFCVRGGSNYINGCVSNGDPSGCCILPRSVTAYVSRIDSFYSTSCGDSDTDWYSVSNDFVRNAVLSVTIGPNVRSCKIDCQKCSSGTSCSKVYSESSSPCKATFQYSEESAVSINTYFDAFEDDSYLGMCNTGEASLDDYDCHTYSSCDTYMSTSTHAYGTTYTATCGNYNHKITIDYRWTSTEPYEPEPEPEADDNESEPADDNESEPADDNESEPADDNESEPADDNESADDSEPYAASANSVGPVILVIGALIASTLA